jgi:hypothetical protein
MAQAHPALYPSLSIEQVAGGHQCDDRRACCGALGVQGAHGGTTGALAQATRARLASMGTAIKYFGDRSADADWAVVYYSGHGLSHPLRR